MTHQIDLRDLRYFETIAELGHLGQAAEKLCRSQPALTSCIRRLEEALGTPLFERVGRGIRLTSAGKVLLERAQRFQTMAEETVREVNDVASGVSGRVRLGLVPTAAQYVLPPACRLLLAEARDVTLKTVIAQNDVLESSLKAGELDLVININPKTDPELVSQEIFDDVTVVVASSSHPIFCKPATMQDLLDHRWVLAAPSVTSRRWLDQAFDNQGLPRPNVQIETNLILLLPPLIIQTGLLSFISRRHLGTGRVGAQLKEIPLEQTMMYRRFEISYRKDGYLSPAARRLVALLCENGKNLFQEDH